MTTNLTKIAIARALHHGDSAATAGFISRRWPDAAPTAKAATTAASTTSAAALVDSSPSSDFHALVRARSVLDRIPARRVPFNTPTPRVTAGASVGWIGEMKPIPATALAINPVNLAPKKAAAIAVVSNDLLRSASSVAEALIEADLAAAAVEAGDTRLLSNAAATDAAPAGLLYGVAAVPRSDDLASDVGAVLAAVPGANVVIVVSAVTAVKLASLRDRGRTFPDVGLHGGSILGAPVLISPAAGSNLIAIDADGLAVATGRIEVDTAENASVQMESAPTNPPTASTVLVSLWQTG